MLNGQTVEQHLAAVGKMACAMEQAEPMLFCDLDGKPTVMVIPMQTAGDKELFAELCKQLIAHSRVTWLSLALESWRSIIPESEKHREEEIMQMPPSERPGASECMVVTISRPEGEQVFMADIITLRGKRTIGKWESMPHFTGRFVNLWKRGKAVTN